MPENEYLKLLGNKVFWGFTVICCTVLFTASGMYFGLKYEMKDISNEVKSIRVDMRYSHQLDSIGRVGRLQRQGEIDAEQNDHIRRLEAVR